MEFKKKKLKNGITVIFEKRELPLVSVSITNRFGGAYEQSQIKGVAHFIEHLVFTGTKTRTHEDISREIEKKGGILNAFTANEATSFWFKIPSEHLFSGLDILVDMLKNPRFDKEKFEKERKVILEEIKMNKDDPQRYVYDLIEKAMFEAPFGEGIIGSEETINKMDRDFVFKLFKETYRGGYIVTIVGNADFKKICEYFEKNFEKPEKGKAEIEIKKKNSEIKIERAGIDQANFILGMHAPLPNDERSYVLEVFDAYMGNGMSSKLFLKIREEKGLAYTVRGTINSEKNYSYYSIYVGTTKEAVEEVKKIIIKEFENIDNMTENDLKEAKERVLGLRDVMREASHNVMNELMYSEIQGDVEEYYIYNKKIRKVRLEDVKKLAKEMIKEYSIALIVPK